MQCHGMQNKDIPKQLCMIDSGLLVFCMFNNILVAELPKLGEGRCVKREKQ